MSFIKFNEAEALRYFGVKKSDLQARELISLAYLKLRNEVQARHVLIKQNCVVDEDGVTLSCGVRFTSKALGRHLKNCSSVLLLGATLGMKVDASIRRLALTSVAEAAAAQAVAAALIESYCDQVQAEHIGVELDNLKQRPRFSPGYGDWALEEQRLLFPVLDCAKKIGLTLTAGGMMAPTKSVTAIIGLSMEALKSNLNNCAVCAKNDCAYRKK